jgi:hypothetical protein
LDAQSAVNSLVMREQRRICQGRFVLVSDVADEDLESSSASGRLCLFA